MANKNLKILLVEDNPKYAEAAKDYFEKEKGLSLVVARDYVEAKRELDAHKKHKTLDRALIDIHFPKQIGSDDISLGYEVMEMMHDCMSKYRHVDRRWSPQKLPRELKNLVEEYGSKSEIVGTYLDRLKKDNNFLSEVENSYGPLSFNAILRLGFERDPSLQPLGVLIAHLLKDIQLPFILTTDTNHHGLFNEEVYTYIRTDRYWKLQEVYKTEVNRGKDKEFWEDAYSYLE